MAVTRLKRKGLRNKANSAKRTGAIKRLTSTPVIKNVDVEAIKEEFAKKGGSKKSTAKASSEGAADTTAKKQEEPTKNHPTDKE